MRVVLRGQLLQLVLHGDSAAFGLRLLPRLCQTLLEIVLVNETIHGILRVGKSRILAPIGLRF